MDFTTYMTKIDYLCQDEFGRTANQVATVPAWRRCFRDNLSPREAVDSVMGSGPDFGFLKTAEV